MVSDFKTSKAIKHSNKRSNKKRTNSISNNIGNKLAFIKNIKANKLINTKSLIPSLKPDIKQEKQGRTKQGRTIEKHIIYYPIQKRTSFWKVLWIVLLFIIFFNLLTALFYKSKGNVALIPLQGVITTSDSGFFQTASSDDIGELIRQAAADSKFKAIVIEINSPGGSAVASEEIANAIEEARHNKTIVAWIRDMGTSGAYWVASSCDWIVANRASITGSIGVKGSYIEVAGLLERYNATYQELASGKFKEMANPFKHLTNDERLRILKKLKEIHNYFKQVVSKNRNLSQIELQSVANGEFFTGIEAKRLKLIDQIGGEPEVKRFLEKELNITPKFEKLGTKKGFLEVLKQVFGDHNFNTLNNNINKVSPLTETEPLLISNYLIIEAK